VKSPKPSSLDKLLKSSLIVTWVLPEISPIDIVTPVTIVIGEPV
jgi:hypothetical protein